MSTEELLNCPCCNFKASIKGGGTRHKVGKLPGRIYCPRCGLTTLEGDLNIQREIWNSRVKENCHVIEDNVTNLPERKR